MLQRLSIQHYAIIQSLDIRFGQGLNIITGETGAGKSILMGALGLVLGDRADSSVISPEAKKAIVEANFEIPSNIHFDEAMRSWDLDMETELILRREVSSTGKSRAFINDSPVTLVQLQQVSAYLVDLHLQFDTQDLGRSSFQRGVLDALCNHRALLEHYGNEYTQYLNLKDRLTALEERKQQALREQDYTRYLLEELSKLSWKNGEMQELESEFNILNHAEQVKTVLGRVSMALEEGDEPALSVIKSVLQQVQPLTAHHPQLPELAARLQSAYLELQDVSAAFSQLADKVQMDAGRLDFINERIAAAQRLMKKHGLQEADQLTALQDKLEQSVGGFSQLEEEIQTTARQLGLAEKNARSLALKVRANRMTQLTPLEESVRKLLQRVGMPNARLQVQLLETELREGGMDQVVFMFDANKTGHFEPLQKVASGGERSRLMLVIKSLVAGSMSMPTLIFDEIDSGISGEAARQVGFLMKELGRKHQVISITHQPQIAARADHHYYVTKQHVGTRIQTAIQLLEGDEHVQAIARMMGGEKPSKSALENAREMVLHP
jgi:DNA repair protein RecN (Recombination protein N)